MAKDTFKVAKESPSEEISLGEISQQRQVMEQLKQNAGWAQVPRCTGPTVKVTIEGQGQSGQFSKAKNKQNWRESKGRYTRHSEEHEGKLRPRTEERRLEKKISRPPNLLDVQKRQVYWPELRDMQ